MSHFAFLQPEWPALFEAASKAEALALPDPRTSCFYARRSLDLVVDWVYTHDSSLTTPYQTHLSALIHEPTFKRATGDAVFNKARVIVKLGNEAVHSARPVHQIDAVSAVRELLHVGYWLAHTYNGAWRDVTRPAVRDPVHRLSPRRSQRTVSVREGG